jgi:hypothetical protein
MQYSSCASRLQVNKTLFGVISMFLRANTLALSNTRRWGKPTLALQLR